MNVFDYVKALYKHQENEDLTEYVPFIVNRALSFSKDTILYANEMNLNYNLDPRLQYDYYFNSIRRGSRSARWIKSPKPDTDFLAVQQFFKYNGQKTRQALAILNNQQLEKIRENLIEGGDE